MGLPLIIGIAALTTYFFGCANTEEETSSNPEDNHTNEGYLNESMQCMEYHANAWTDHIMSQTDFDCYSYSEATELPPLQICVEKGLPKNAADYLANQTTACIQKNLNEVGGNIPPNMDQINAFLIHDKDVAQNLLGGGDAAVKTGSGETTYHVDALSPNGNVYPWEVAETQNINNDRCIDPIISHETFHFINWQSPTTNGKIYNYHTTLEEGLARQRELQAEGIEPKYSYVHRIDSLDGLVDAEANIFDCIINGDETCDIDDYKCCEEEHSNWVEMHIVEGQDPFTVKFTSYSEYGLTFQIKDGSSSSLHPDECRPVFNNFIPELQGGITCFLLDSENPDSAEIIITSAATTRLDIICDDANKTVNNKTITDIGDRLIPNDSSIIAGNFVGESPYGEYGVGDIRSYGTGYCFWSKIEDKYGDSAIPNVISALQALGTQPADLYTLDIVDVVAKTVNEDKETIEELFNFYNLHTKIENPSIAETYSYYPYCEEEL